MSSQDSRFLKLLNLLRRSGLRSSIGAVASSLAREYGRVPVNVLDRFEMVLSDDYPARLSPAPGGPLRVNWVLLDVVVAQGGLLNIFRTIQQLEAWGHENRIYLVAQSPSAAKAKQIIRERYFPVNAQVEVFSPKIEDSDALIATSWPTAYLARGIGNTSQKFYFVQDIEYMFYAPGSVYEFARQTYRFGFRGITLGSWISDVLQAEFDMECSAFGFSYDRDAYASTGRHLLPSGKKRVLFYARPETERRGFELGVLALALVAKEMPNVQLVFVGCPPESLDLPFPATVLGVLPISDLGALYRSCDVGLVLSHTNLSMLPLELMACGCAVISNEGPNVQWLLTDDTVQFAKPDPYSLAEAVIELLQSDEQRRRKIEAARAFAASTDWTKEIRRIESALLVYKDPSGRLVPTSTSLKSSRNMRRNDPCPD